MLRIASFLFIALTFACCQNQSQPAEQAAPAEQPAVEQPALEATLPSIPLALLERIYTEGTQVDLIFYNHPFTMSMTERPAIQHATRLIADKPAPINPNCKSVGRITYQIDGDIVLDGNFYFTTGCTYFVFYENQEKKYANYMTDEGINYFNNQIQQATQMQKQAQQKAQGQ